MMKFLILSRLLLAAPLNAQVLVESLPESGIQPQTAVTSDGLVHLVYLKGDPKACDIRYMTRRATGGDWSAPLTVNSTPHSAIASGTIRGAQIAPGKAGSVQVIWNGNSVATADGPAQSPLLYARLIPGAKAFTAHQNLLGETTSLDGGASIAANEKGRIAVVWHAAPPGRRDEGERLVWVRYSDDDGAAFSAPAPLNAAQPGVCACCSLRAGMAADGTLSVLYRAATTPTDRGMRLITDHAGKSTSQKLDDWRTAVCPMSSASMMPSGTTLWGAWENDGQIITGLLEPGAVSRKIGPQNAKHPILAQNAQGRTLIASIIGSGWAKAGTLHWDIMDEQGKVTVSGDGGKLPVWSYATSYARPDGVFVILF